MIILGIGGLLNDAACAVLKDGALVAAVEQKKVARRFQPGELPGDAIAACLGIAGADAEEVGCVAIVRPFTNGPEAPIQLQLRDMFPRSEVVLVEHHVAHAASAAFASPFENTTVLTLDRHGDFRCGARWKVNGPELTLDKELYHPDSLGELYGRVTALLGFEPEADEHLVEDHARWIQAMLPTAIGAYHAVFAGRLGHCDVSARVCDSHAATECGLVADHLRGDIVDIGGLFAIRRRRVDFGTRFTVSQ